MGALRGSCLCGGVAFEVAEPPATLRWCHCESCKKLSGGVGTVNIMGSGAGAPGTLLYPGGTSPPGTNGTSAIQAGPGAGGSGFNNGTNAVNGQGGLGSVLVQLIKPYR